MGYITQVLARRERRKMLVRLIQLSLLGCVAADVIYVVSLRSDVMELTQSANSTPIALSQYERQRHSQPDLAPLRWRPVPLAQIPLHVQQAVLAGQDATYWDVSGIAFLRGVMDFDSLRLPGFVASTVSAQTVRSLVAGGPDSWVGGWHASWAAWFLEMNVHKSRILELYLNSTRLGPGLFGVEAAAQAYWNKSVTQLSHREGVEMAAIFVQPNRLTQEYAAAVQQILAVMTEKGWQTTTPAEAEPTPTPNNNPEGGGTATATNSVAHPDNAYETSAKNKQKRRRKRRGKRRRR